MKKVIGRDQMANTNGIILEFYMHLRLEGYRAKCNYLQYSRISL